MLQFKVVIYFIYSMQAAASAVAAEWSDYMCTLGKSELTRSVSPRDGRCTVQCTSVGWSVHVHTYIYTCGQCICTCTCVCISTIALTVCVEIQCCYTTSVSIGIV